MPIFFEQTEVERTQIFKRPIRLSYSEKQSKRDSCIVVTLRSYILIGTRAFAYLKTQLRPMAELRALSERNAFPEEFKSMLDDWVSGLRIEAKGSWISCRPYLLHVQLSPNSTHTSPFFSTVMFNAHNVNIKTRANCEVLQSQ